MHETGLPLVRIGPPLSMQAVERWEWYWGEFENRAWLNFRTQGGASVRISHRLRPPRSRRPGILADREAGSTPSLPKRQKEKSINLTSSAIRSSAFIGRIVRFRSVSSWTLMPSSVRRCEINVFLGLFWRWIFVVRYSEGAVKGATNRKILNCYGFYILWILKVCWCTVVGQIIPSKWNDVITIPVTVDVYPFFCSQ